MSYLDSVMLGIGNFIQAFLDNKIIEALQELTKTSMSRRRIGKPGKGQSLGACALLYLQQPRGQEGFPKRLVSLPKSARCAARDEVVAVTVFDAGATSELKVVSQQESTTLLH